MVHSGTVRADGADGCALDLISTSLIIYTSKGFWGFGVLGKEKGERE